MKSSFDLLYQRFQKGALEAHFPGSLEDNKFNDKLCEPVSNEPSMHEYVYI